MTTPFWCVLAALVLIYVPRFMVIFALSRGPEPLDNKHPRDQQARLTGWGRRAQAAHNNSFEVFAPFAAAVIIAHIAGADPAKSAIFAVLFVLCRTLYLVVYVANLDKVRSTIWILGMASTFALFWLAATAP